MSDDTVLLSDLDLYRCQRFGQLVIDGYQNGSKSIARSINGAENDVGLIAHSRAAEVAFCYWSDLDPLAMLDWGNRPDPGYDVLARGKKVDIKALRPGYSRLIWPLSKTDMFEEKPFEVLFAVEMDGRRGTMRRWCTKTEFEAMRQTAGEGHALQPGTWYVPLDRLHTPGEWLT